MSRRQADVRRFGVAATIGAAVTAVPYLWILCDLWTDAPSLLRTAKATGFASNFYDLQARAMFAGHLSVARSPLGIEAYTHDGRVYTYFGLFPSLLRMPVLLITHSFDGRLTALSLLVAWLTSGLFSSLFVWRVRTMVRGPAALGRAEAAAFGVFVASVMGGSTVIFLAASPNVYAEDLAWSVAVTIGSLFALCGVLERPSRGRVAVSGLLILAASLTRAPTGYACVIAAVLVAGWFALGRGGAEHRRWWLPVLAAGLVPFAIGCVVNMAKFGVPVGLPINEGTAFKVLHGPNGGHEFSVRFLPSTLYAYLRPNGVRFTTAFPFVTMPSTVATGVWGVSVYGNRTASLTASMPLFFLLGAWGVISAFRPRPSAAFRAIRILLVAAALGAGAVLVFGWIYDRYLADFLPFLVLGAALGLVDVWRRLDGHSRRLRMLALSAVAALGLYGAVANIGMALTPTDTWSPDQVLHYVQAQKRIGDVTGARLSAERGYRLPNWAPPDQLFVMGHCEAVYISDGETLQSNVNDGMGWLKMGQADQQLCRSLVPDHRLTQQEMGALLGADRALGQTRASLITWTLEVTALGANPSTGQLVGPTDRLATALDVYDVAIQRLRVGGDASARAEALLASIRSMEGDLFPPAFPTGPMVVGLVQRTDSDWTRVVAASDALLAVT